MWARCRRVRASAIDPSHDYEAEWEAALTRHGARKPENRPLERGNISLSGSGGAGGVEPSGVILLMRRHDHHAHRAGLVTSGALLKQFFEKAVDVIFLNE